MIRSNSIINTQFAEDVRKGLRAHVKNIPSRYFYNTEGDALFQQIMAMPEYYLTRAEYQIFDIHKEQILQLFIQYHGFDLIEFGAGDGYKTQVLIEHLIQQSVDFTYQPIDISANALYKLENRLADQFPALKIQIQEGEYFQQLEQLSQKSARAKLVLFLGSNIGNFSRDELHRFLENLYAHLQSGDGLLLGYDLKKDPHLILNAYNDAKGITREFNFNVLRRINQELGADFIIDNFSHFPMYDPVQGAAKSYLVSKKKQVVFIEALDESFVFERGEPIFTEISQKFDNKTMDTLAEQIGFRVDKHFQDGECYFTDALWIKD